MVGVIGVGVCGTAIKTTFEKFNVPVVGYDKFKAEYPWTTEIVKTKMIFVCVPTPTINDLQDITALDECLSILCSSNYDGVVIIKSTILPGTTQAMSAKYLNLRLVHCPEFLTEKNALDDFMTEKNCIISGADRDCAEINNFFKETIGERIMCYSEDYEVTELAKYMHNCYLALKVSFCNEFYSLSNKLGIHYDVVRDFTVHMGKMSKVHTQVPGPDNKFGFGGMCLPKELDAIIPWATRKGVLLNTMVGARNTNQITQEKNVERYCELGY